MQAQRVKKTIAHDDVTQRATARKILKKIIDLATRIELTLSILMPRPGNLLKNSIIHFHICSYFATYLLTVIKQELLNSSYLLYNTVKNNFKYKLSGRTF